MWNTGTISFRLCSEEASVAVGSRSITPANYQLNSKRTLPAGDATAMSTGVPTGDLGGPPNQKMAIQIWRNWIRATY